MIAWTVPWALAGLLVLAGPLLVHMLLRRNARRIVFPTTRFLPRTRASAVRFRRPSDVGLLILRGAIVLAAVLACAQPVLLSGWRTGRWNQRTATALVVDTSRSVHTTPDIARLADQELQGFASAKFATADLREGLRRAADWLSHTPPARREIVIVSDFQRGAIDAETLAAIPTAVGVRFIRAGTPSATATLPAIAGWRGATWQPRIALRGNAVDVTYAADGADKKELAADSADGADKKELAADSADGADKKELAADSADGADKKELAADSADGADKNHLAAEGADKKKLAADRAGRADNSHVAADRADSADKNHLAAESTDRKKLAADRTDNADIKGARVHRKAVPGLVTTRQPEGDTEAAAAAMAGAESFGIAADGDHRAVVAFAGAADVTGEQALSTPWMLKAALDLRQSSLLRETGAGVTFAEQDGALVVHTDVRASSAAAPGVLRAVMLALRPAAITDPELETATIPDADLAAWRRDAGPAERGHVVISDGVESRWLWAAALVLLGIEAWVRRRTPAAQQQVHADAA